MAITNVDFIYLNWPYLHILIIFSTLLLYIALTKCGKYSSSHSSPPSPPALPIIGHIHLLGSALPRSFQTLALRYGPLMRIRVGSSNSFLVGSTPDVARQILKTHDVNFPSRFEVGPVQYSIYQGIEFITAPYSPEYRFLKKICVTKLFAGSQLNQFRHIRDQEICACLRAVMKSSEKGDGSCNLTARLVTLTNNIIFRMIMWKKYDKYVDTEVKVIKELAVKIMELGAKCGIYEVFGPLKKYDLFGHGKKLWDAMVMYDNALEKIIGDYENESGRSDGPGDDLIEILLKASIDANAEVKLTRKQIKQFILDLLFSSIDTTSAALQWTMAELINHPRVFKKLREEIQSTNSHGLGILMTELDIPNLPYLQAVVKESLRLHNPSPLIFRECTKPCIISGYNIKVGTRVFLNAYAIMRDPAVWRDPDTFEPERFLDSTEGRQLDKPGQEFGFIPFGGGRRACIGSSHASAVLQTTVGALIQCFDWEVKDGDKVDINIVSGFSGAMARPLICYPKVHLNPF